MTTDEVTLFGGRSNHILLRYTNVAMNSTTVTLPAETKEKLDRTHTEIHLTQGIPRWKTIEIALDALAYQEDINVSE